MLTYRKYQNPKGVHLMELQEVEPRRFPGRQILSFSKEELIDALSEYAGKRGYALPPGRRLVWGLEYNRSNGEDEQIKLVIEMK
jgi:hypothetical protein